jgi:hypothetical protein
MFLRIPNEVEEASPLKPSHDNVPSLYLSRTFSRPCLDLEERQRDMEAVAGGAGDTRKGETGTRHWEGAGG